MNIRRAAHFTGPNIYSTKPVIRYQLSGLKQLETREIDATRRDALLRLLPDLGSVTLPCEASDFFTSRDAADRLLISHAIEHVAVALQNQSGSELMCARSNSIEGMGNRTVILAYEEVEVCDAAAQLGCHLIERVVSSPSDSDSDSVIVDEFAPQIDSFLSMARRRMLPIQDRTFLRAAQDRDVPARRIAGRIIQLGHGHLQNRVSATKTTLTNVVSNDIAANKDYSRRILEGLGLPMPRYERVNRSRDAVGAAECIGYPVVVKPNQGNMGHAVSVGMRNSREVGAAYKRARVIDRSVLVEEFIDGDDFRVLVIDGEFCAASKRTPGHVVGDGVSTVETLVAELNADPRRGSGPRSPWTRLEFDEQADRLLADRKMTRTSIPADDETVYLRRNANTSDGGTAMDVTDDVHPDNREIAVRAARAVGLDIAGVDFLTTDIGRSMWRTGGVICEINSRPGLRKHMWPANGPARDIMTPIVDMLYPRDQPSRIPVVGVLGIDRRTARGAARMLSHLLQSSGRHVGLAVNHRVYFDGRRSRSGRMKTPAATQMILLYPTVEVAVLEMTVTDVVRDGLGCDAFEILLIISDEEGAEAVAGPSKLSTKARDAIRVVAGATRTSIFAKKDSELVCSAIVEEAAEVGDVEFVPVDGDDDAPEFAASKKEISPSDAIAHRDSATLVSRAALQLGLSKRQIRRALRRLDPSTGRGKIRRRKG